MAVWVVCLLALAVGGTADSGVAVPDPVDLLHQIEVLSLYYHIEEPTHVPEIKKIAENWSIEKNINQYNNVTAVKLYLDMLDGKWILPRGVPFTILEETQRYEASTLFNVLHSAKDYTTFYSTCAYLRDHINEELFIYVLNSVIIHRHDTQNIVIPPIYEVLPSYFFNGEVITTSQRINTHGLRMVEHYPSTYIWNNNVVIKWNETVWPYHSADNSVAYFTHDYHMNAIYYNLHVGYLSKIIGESCPLMKEGRGEYFWFAHKQLVARYYLERLSNNLGEIPDLNIDVVKQGYNSGLVHKNGIPFPIRPNDFHLAQPEFVDKVNEIVNYERRIRDAIDIGYVTHLGEHISLRKPEHIDTLGRLIAANPDSPNVDYYKDFISLWKTVLGNSVVNHHTYNNNYMPYVLPSVLEHEQTALRDPAFYMIWKRVLKLFTQWQKTLPMYKPEELSLPHVSIEKVELDKLVTYFEHAYVNITGHLHLDEHELTTVTDDVSVLVQYPRLAHKKFEIRVNVKSEVAKTVSVKFYIAPKYDSYGNEIPLNLNSENFVLLEQFKYELPAGETVIRRDSSQFTLGINDWNSGWDLFQKTENTLRGKEQFIPHLNNRFDATPNRLILPKGRIGGMPFVLMVYINQHVEPNTTGPSDHTSTRGFGPGPLFLKREPLGFPVNRPLYQWQVENIKNLWLQDILIHHKETPEVHFPFTA